MTKENYTLEDLLARILVVQSKLEYEANALEALIKTAYHYAETKDQEFIYLLDTLKSKTETIKNTVQTIEG